MNERVMKTQLNLAAILAFAFAVNALAQSDTYPIKPIRWVIPFQPGGGTDMVARPVAARLTDRVGQQILYDNRGGGGGVIAGEIVANANPDGYTLLVAAVAVVRGGGRDEKISFYPVKEFITIHKIWEVAEKLPNSTAPPVGQKRGDGAEGAAQP